MFYYYLLFQLTNEINSFIEMNYGDHNLYTLQTKLRISRLLRSWCQTCRACCARRDVLCRACCTACATQHVWLFPIPKCMGSRDVMQQVEFGLIWLLLTINSVYDRTVRGRNYRSFL